MNKLAMIAASAGLLAGCGATPAQQQTLATAGLTLAAIAAQNNMTVAKVVTQGQLFCQLGGGLGIVALVNAAQVPVTVMNQTATAVADACAAFQAVPVAPPANPDITPVKVLPSLPAMTS